jgi:ubiquinol-cytochrome c reductase iron-sulfur subunit
MSISELDMATNPDMGRRRLLTAMTTVVGAIGAVAVATPLLLSMKPSARAQSAGAPVEADFSKLEPGQLLTVEWRGQPVWILRRTERNLRDLPSLNDLLLDPDSTNTKQQPEYAHNPLRSIRPDVVVLIGICTHLGCAPSYRPDVSPPDLGADWKGGFYCPCHGSRFDLAGRVYKGVPAPSNLVVPPYRFLGGSRLLIGEDATTT